jgi:hypothetical protein
MTAANKTATFHYYGGTVVVDSPYSESVVSAIKSLFTRPERDWDPERKTWKIYIAARPDGEEDLNKLIGVCLQEDWSVRKVMPSGERTTIYPTGEIVTERQEELFG